MFHLAQELVCKFKLVLIVLLGYVRDICDVEKLLIIQFLMKIMILEMMKFLLNGAKEAL